MPFWLVLTLLASFGQNVRSSVQKSLKGRLSTGSVTFVRFGFGWPFALAFLVAIGLAGGEAEHAPGLAFVAWSIAAALAQIGAQALLIALFSHRNFAAGSAYARVEAVQAALLAPAMLGEGVSALAWAGIGLGAVGVLTISATDDLRPMALVRVLGTRAALMGLGSATLFGFSANAYRAASLTLGAPEAPLDALHVGATTNGFAIVFQTVLLGAWLTWREPEQWRAIAAAWRPSLLVGFVGASVSLGWFAAFALQQAAIVKAVAQVELVFAIITSALVFQERVRVREIAGMALIGLGVAVLVLLG